MEMQINELVSAIKKEGVIAAQAEADRIIAEANEKAAAIIAKAKSEADAEVKKAEEKIGNLQVEVLAIENEFFGKTAANS